MGPSAFNEISVFSKKAGLGHVRSALNQLFVSSGKDCGGLNSCFTSIDGNINAYKLTMQQDWVEFPFYEEAKTSLRYYIMTETEDNCLSADTTNKLFAILCPSKDNRPKRLYLPLDCEKMPLRMISFEVGLHESIQRQPIVRDTTILDSLIATFHSAEEIQYHSNPQWESPTQTHFPH